MSQGYKDAKEAFVSGLTGSNIFHVNSISLNALISVALFESIRGRIQKLPFLLQFAILIMPLLGSVTVFAERPWMLFALLSGLMGLVSYLPLKKLPPPLSPRVTPRGNLDHEEYTSSTRINITPSPAVTVYRAHMMLMTLICILAIDFPIFPRSLAKCETFGVSVMDLGVGSFVFSQGLVSALPIIKDINYLIQPTWPKVKASTMKVVPLLVLGLVRLILVKGTDYPEHASEYGTHWNFFLTLALLPPFQALLHPVILYLPLLVISLGISLVGQSLLSFTALQNWVLEAPRTTLISHNKEGIISAFGYLSIHVMGLLTGTLVFPTSPSTFKRQLKQLFAKGSYHESDGNNEGDFHGRYEEKGGAKMKRKDDKLVIELIAYSILWWSLLGLCKLVGFGGDVSRRLANLQYVLWIAAYNTSFLSCYVLLWMLYRASEAPSLLMAINKNGLVIFLLANVLTGLINLSMKTIYSSNSASLTILCNYLLVISTFAWLFRNRRLVKL